MNDLQKALHEFWSQFQLDGKPIPAYISGQAQDGVFPAITYEMRVGTLYNQSSMVALIWLQEQDGVSVNEQRADIFRQVCAALPEEGVRLDYDGGFCVLYRNVDFVSQYNTGEVVQGRKLYGGRIAYIMRHYGGGV